MKFKKSILFGMAILFIVACSPIKKDNGAIIVNNKTDNYIYNINFEYSTSKRIDVIGDLAPNTSYKYKIQYSDTEDSIKIKYTDKNKKNYSTPLVAYSAKYDKENFIFDIN